MFTFIVRVDVFVCFLVFIFSQNQNLGFSCGAFEFLEGYNQASVTKNLGDEGNCGIFSNHIFFTGKKSQDPVLVENI